MAILISGHFIYTGRVGGAEQMVYNLIGGMEGLGVDVTLVCSDRKNLSPDFLDTRCSNYGKIIESGGGGPRFLSEQRACLDRRLHADAILFPNYYIPPITPSRLGSTAVVIHDFQYRHFPQYFSARKRAWLRLSHWRAFAQADKVIVISEFVRRDAIRIYGRRAERATVIPNPVSWERFLSAPSPHPYGGRPYLLSVAAHYPHKQLDVLVRAMAALRARHPDLLLVLCGQLPEKLVSVGRDLIGLPAMIRELGLADRIVMTGFLNDAALGRLYNHAAAFAFPSLFEGFGMPAVEALGFGLPTLTTRRTALPEATLGLAEFVDNPSDPAEWAARLDAMINGPRLAPAVIQRVRDQYSIDAVAQRYVGELGETVRVPIAVSRAPKATMVREN